MSEVFSGVLRKMRTRADAPVSYALPLNDIEVAINPLIGKTLRLAFSGKIFCIHCGRATKKSFSQGYCYPCFRKLAECDTCITRPETCHYHHGTCREPAWGEAHCFRDHVVYLANASGIKVGITRLTQVPTRWMDQGAVAAMPVYRTRDRLLSGKVEVILKAHVSDRTNWRTMLKGKPESVDLGQWRNRLLGECRSEIKALLEKNGLDAVTEVPDAEPAYFDYPVLRYPEKVTSMNPEKIPLVEADLWGIKGQYLIFDKGVMNIRNAAGYEASLTIVE
ncbi:MAG TPA: DUF2797 domain-containing protein [Pseudomonadales bacterium]